MSSEHRWLWKASQRSFSNPRSWAGRIFTETGRQPWIVYPNPEFEGTNDPLGRDKIHMIVDFGVSNHSTATVWTSVITFTLLYGVLAVIWFWRIKRQTLADPLLQGSSMKIAASEYGPSTDDIEPLTFSATATGGEK